MPGNYRLEAVESSNFPPILVQIPVRTGPGGPAGPERQYARSGARLTNRHGSVYSEKETLYTNQLQFKF